MIIEILIVIASSAIIGVVGSYFMAHIATRMYINDRNKRNKPNRRILVAVPKRPASND